MALGAYSSWSKQVNSSQSQAQVLKWTYGLRRMPALVHSCRVLGTWTAVPERACRHHVSSTSLAQVCHPRLPDDRCHWNRRHQLASVCQDACLHPGYLLTRQCVRPSHSTAVPAASASSQLAWKSHPGMPPRPGIEPLSKAVRCRWSAMTRTRNRAAAARPSRPRMHLPHACAWPQACSHPAPALNRAMMHNAQRPTSTQHVATDQAPAPTACAADTTTTQCYHAPLSPPTQVAPAWASSPSSTQQDSAPNALSSQPTTGTPRRCSTQGP